MKIACVDQTAADRAKLQQLIDGFYEQCRSEVGHITLLHTFPASKDEILINTAPDIVIIGPGFSTENAFATCRDLRNAFPNLPILLFLSNNNYSLRTLRRFQKVCNEIFSHEDSPTRVIHKLFSFETNKVTNSNGSLILVAGVKGGVGTTTIVGGLAHAAQSLGKSCLVIDLSQHSVLIQYMSAERWQSVDYAAALTDGFSPDRSLIERCITVAPNGVHLLLPPAGGMDIRELWLRNPNRFEITLTMIETLKEMYDLVLVDTANSEGILPFALNTRAHSNILVTSNDPASVHLLHSRLAQKATISGHCHTHILINLLHEKSLTKEDLLDFLYENENFTPSMAALAPLKYDSRGKNWIGTENTFYTESSTTVQQLLEEIIITTTLSTSEIEKRLENNQQNLFQGVIQKQKNKPSRKKLRDNILLLPFSKQNIEQVETDTSSLKPLSLEHHGIFTHQQNNLDNLAEQNIEEFSLAGKPSLNNEMIGNDFINSKFSNHE